MYIHCIKSIIFCQGSLIKGIGGAIVINTIFTHQNGVFFIVNYIAKGV